MAKKKIELEQGSADWHKMRKRCQEDLYWLNAKVLGYESILPMTYSAHYGMCRFAERKTGIPEIDGSRVQLIQYIRGAGKSTLITQGRTIQRLLKDRNWAAGIANEQTGKAMDFLSTIKNQFESNQLLRFLFPELVPDTRKNRWSRDAIMINRDPPGSNPVNPSVLAAGVEKAVTGVHMCEWIVDDVISDEAAENARSGLFTEFEKANRWITRLPPLLTNFMEDPITFIGTPWWPGDCYDFIREHFGGDDRGRDIIWTLTHPNGDKQKIMLEHRGDLAVFKLAARDEDGRSVYPEKYPEEMLDKWRREDPHFYSAQAMLIPTAGEAATFKEDWLKEFQWSAPGKVLMYQGFDGRTHFERIRDMTIILSVDPATGKKWKKWSGLARTAIAVTATNGVQNFLIETWTQRAGATDTAEQIIAFYKKYRCDYIVIEDVAYQEALKDVLDLLAKDRNVLGRLPIYAHKTGSDLKKDTRILGLEPYFNKGFFHYHKRSQEDFLEEYNGFPNMKWKDLLDALSMQKELWERISTRDPDRDPNKLTEFRNQSRGMAERIRANLGRMGRGRRVVAWEDR